MSQDKKTPDAEDAPEAQADAAPEKSDADDAGAGGTAAAEAADGDAAVSEAPEDEADAVPEAPADAAPKAPADAAPEESDADDAGAGGTAAAEAADDDAAVSEAPEDEAPEGEAPAEAAEETAEVAVERLEAKVAELDDKLLRAVAETENLRRRAAREREETGKYAITGFAREMLTVVDNLRRALDSLPERSAGGEAGGEESLAGLVAGIEVTERELLAVFERQGIRRIDPMGEKFDPNFHQAVFEVADSGQPAGTVVQVVQAGYVIADRLLRPAMVGVAKAAKDDADAKDAAAHIDTEA